MKKSYTLIEILIVVAIIAILFSIIGISYSSSQKRSRDTKRIADMNLIVAALNTYKREKGSFPDETMGNTPLSGWETSLEGEGAGGFMEYLQPYISGEFVDPKNKGNYYYAYRYYQNGSGSCNDENRDNPFVVLAIRRMEVEKNKFNERAKCDGYDWGSRFDYSIKIMK